MVMYNGRALLTTTKAAELAGVSRQTIYAWVKAGRLECVRNPVGGIRIYADSLWRQPEPATTSPDAA